MCRRVLVLRQPDEFSRVLERSGLCVVNLELIRPEPSADQGELLEMLVGPIRYDGVFITSPVAAEVLVGCLEDLNRPTPGKIYVLGERSRKVFNDAGIHVEFNESANRAEELIAWLQNDLAGKRFCFLRGDRSMRTIPNLLQGKALIDEIEVYRTVDVNPNAGTVDDIKARLQTGSIDWACFFSPSAVDAFETIFGHVGVSGFKTAALGATTAQRASQLGFDVAFVSPSANAEAFAHSFAEKVNEN